MNRLVCTSQNVLPHAPTQRLLMSLSSRCHNKGLLSSGFAKILKISSRDLNIRDLNGERKSPYSVYRIEEQAKGRREKQPGTERGW